MKFVLGEPRKRTTISERRFSLLSIPPTLHTRCWHAVPRVHRSCCRFASPYPTCRFPGAHTTVVLRGSARTWWDIPMPGPPYRFRQPALRPDAFPSTAKLLPCLRTPQSPPVSNSSCRLLALDQCRRSIFPTAVVRFQCRDGGRPSLYSELRSDCKSLAL